MLSKLTNIIRNRRCWGLLFLSAVLFGLAVAQVYAQHYDTPIPLDIKRLVSVRESGRLHDTKAIPDLIAVLTEKPAVNTRLALTAIHSLAQLGAEEALPDIDTYEAAQKVSGTNIPDERTINYIKAARARLVAEASVSDLKTEPQKTNAEVLRLCQELGLSVADINKAAAINKAQQNSFNKPPILVEVYAMREIADIIYGSSLSDVHTVSNLNGLNFSLDYPSQLKIQLIGLSEAKRIDWLINDLSHKKALTEKEDYEIQLAVDIGLPAGKAAFAQLVSMDGHREVHKSAGFGALIKIVYATDYQSVQIQEHFLKDADSSVSNFAYVPAGDGVPGY